MFRPGNPMPSRHSQPRPEADETARLPSAAERARTLVQGNASGVLVIPGLDRVDLQHMVPAERSVTADGDVLLLLAHPQPEAVQRHRYRAARRFVDATVSSAGTPGCSTPASNSPSG
jgi:hypothetical protein